MQGHPGGSSGGGLLFRLKTASLGLQSRGRRLSFEIFDFKRGFDLRGGFFSGSGGADSRKKGPGRARPAECFSENAVSGKTILVLLRPEGANSPEGLFAAEAANSAGDFWSRFDGVQRCDLPAGESKGGQGPPWFVRLRANKKIEIIFPGTALLGKIPRPSRLGRRHQSADW